MDIDEFMIDHKAEMLKIADFLDIAKKEILFIPSIANEPVSNKYISRMNDDFVRIKRPVKQLLMLNTRGYKYFKENKEKIDWRIIFPLIKISILKATKNSNYRKINCESISICKKVLS